MLQAFSGLVTLVDTQVVEDHHIPFAQCRRQLRLNVSLNANRVIGPSMIHGVHNSLHRSPARKVWVFQRPKGALMRSRWPLRERPRSRVISALTYLSFRNIKPVRLLAHARLTLGMPDPALIPHIGACALCRHQAFFYI